MISGVEAVDTSQHPLASDEEAQRFFDATFEAMYLMVAADGVVGPEEKDVLRGAIRELTAGLVRTAHIEKFAEQCRGRQQNESADVRLRAVADTLKKDKTAAEAAFVLSAVMAFADEEVADEEDDMLNDFADYLGIDGQRANQLLDELEQKQRD